jgi:hypothetical protein
MTEAKIKADLIQLHVGIKNSDGALVSDSLNNLELVLASHRGQLHPQLLHFLEGRSYAKALAWLGGGDELLAKPASPPGGCGGGHA